MQLYNSVLIKNNQVNVTNDHEKFYHNFFADRVDNFISTFITF